MSELKPFEVIMRIDFAASDKTQICAHAEKIQELVRCKDCKHFYVGKFANGCFLDHDENVNSLPPDFFCADGERRDDE